MSLCPCGSGDSYASCCEPYHKGLARAPTAEAFMRSRYSAYAMQGIDYIINTSMNRDVDRKSTQEWSEKSKWLGLKIISTEKGSASDKEGTVEFEATYERNGLRDVHHEKAEFKKEKDSWLYVDGEITPYTVVRVSPKTGRNDPCPCSSGKKFKHCCG